MHATRIAGRRRPTRLAVALVAIGIGLAAMGGCSGHPSGSFELTTPATGGTTQVANANAAAERLRGATFTAHYSGTSSPPQEFASATLTVYKDVHRTRVDVSFAGTNSALAYSEIVDGDGHFLCFEDGNTLTAALADAAGAATTPTSGGRGGAPLCTRAATGANSILDFDALATALVHGDVLPTASRTIAGEAGDCYAGSDAGTGVPQEICISQHGALLYLSTSGGQQDELRATSIESTVDDHVFALPYRLVDTSPAQ
jgi:hypothetical protein